MNIQTEKFLRNEFLTMSILGALGRSKTYSESVSAETKNHFRIALREKLDHISRMYESSVTEKDHLLNIKKLSDDLTSLFSHCLRGARFRIGIAQKALNLYLKYLWCANLLGPPPHCPFDSIIIGYLPNCGDLKWTSIDTVEEYTRLVESARKVANDRTLAEWELDIWLVGIQSERIPKYIDKSNTADVNQTRILESTLSRFNQRDKTLIIGSVTSQGHYKADNKDICEIRINKKSADALPHSCGGKHFIYLILGHITYEASVHETRKGVVWISSVLNEARLVDALAMVGLKKGDKITIMKNIDGHFLLQPCIPIKTNNKDAR